MPDWSAAIAQARKSDDDSLVLPDVAVTSDQFQDLKSGFPTLQRLEVNVSRLEAQDLADVLSALPELRQLHLSGPVDGDMLQAIADIPKLTVLNLSQATFDDASLRAIENHPQLELLRLRAPHLTDQGLEIISHMPALRFLHLIDVPITDAGLPTLYNVKQLESFYLDGSACTEEGLSELVRKRPDLHFHWNQLHLPGDPNAHSHE